MAISGIFNDLTNDFTPGFGVLEQLSFHKS